MEKRKILVRVRKWQLIVLLILAGAGILLTAAHTFRGAGRRALPVIQKRFKK